jgi:hypothetical protein
MPQTRLPSAVTDDGNLIWEDVEDDVEEDEDRTCEDDIDDDVNMNDIDDEALSTITYYAYKHNNKVSYISIL